MIKTIKTNRIFQTQRKTICICFLSLLFGLLMTVFIGFHSYAKMGITNIVPVDSLLFLLIGISILGLSCFSVLQLHQYKTGKLFAAYTFFLGVSTALAPCVRLNEPWITLIRSSFSFGSAILLFRIIGYLTLLKKKRLFILFQGILTVAVIAGMLGQVLSFFPLNAAWIYLLAAESLNGCVISSAAFSLIMMAVNYKKSNAYARKQSCILLWGMSVGIFLFILASVVPNVYLVQSSQPASETLIQLSITPNETVIASVPLLLFSGVSISILFMMMRREFVLYDTRLKVRQFLFIPLYFGVADFLLFTYASCPLWLLLCMNLLLLLPVLTGIQKMFRPADSTEEQTYHWRLMEAVEKEKQELSSYLHDDVLQSLIAFYRQVQADESGRYSDMKHMLSDLISQIRNVSHNLYPTMVEDLGLEQSLQIFVSELQKSYPSPAIDFQYRFTDGILPKSVALAFYRISKELTTNAAKHSGCSKIMLCLREDENGYFIRVQDNGSGFELPQNDDLLQSPHMGLYTVKKQVMGLHGQMRFTSSPHTGTDYYIYFPKMEEQETDA